MRSYLNGSTICPEWPLTTVLKADPAVKVPKAISLCVPVGGVAGFFFIVPLCATLPPLADVIEAPVGQALPYVFHTVMGSP